VTTLKTKHVNTQHSTDINRVVFAVGWREEKRIEKQKERNRISRRCL